MKVALLGSYPVNANRVSGGPEAVMVQLAQSLRGQGDMDVHVVTASGAAPADLAVERDGLLVHVVRLRRVPRWTMLRANPRLLARMVAEIGPDVVHAHSTDIYADAALASGVPAVITIHGVIQREAQVNRQHGLRLRQRWSWAYDQWYEQWCLRRASDLIAISPYVEQFYQGRTRARLHRVENPVADVYFDLPDRTEPATILCAARVIPRKNILTLLRAFALLRRDVPQARLRIAGETHYHPDYAEQCRQFVREQGLEGAVEFLGWLDEPGIQAEYSRCAAVALVSWQETAPVAIEQAMAAGKPVVASDVGGVRYLLGDGQFGLLVQPDEAAGQAMALGRVLLDPTLRQRIGQASRQEAERRFRAAAIGRQTRAIYEEVIRLQSGAKAEGGRRKEEL